MTMTPICETCKVILGTVHLCPLHAAARDLLEAAEELVSEWPLSGLSETDREELIDALRAAASRARGIEWSA